MTTQPRATTTRCHRGAAPANDVRQVDTTSRGRPLPDVADHPHGSELQHLQRGVVKLTPPRLRGAAPCKWWPSSSSRPSSPASVVQHPPSPMQGVLCPRLRPVPISGQPSHHRCRTTAKGTNGVPGESMTTTTEGDHYHNVAEVQHPANDVRQVDTTSRGRPLPDVADHPHGSEVQHSASGGRFQLVAHHPRCRAFFAPCSALAPSVDNHPTIDAERPPRARTGCQGRA